MGVTTSRKFYDHLNVLFIHSGAKSSGLIHLVPSLPKAEIPQVGTFFCTQFPSLGISINKKVRNQKN